MVKIYSFSAVGLFKKNVVSLLREGGNEGFPTK